VRSTENIKKLVKNLDLDIDTNAETDQTILNRLLEAQQETKRTGTASAVPNIGRTIMRSPITKLAAAAAAIIVVALGLLEFVGDGGTSGIVLADVDRKVQASRGVIFRSKDFYDDRHDYTMKYLSSTYSRLDSYKGDQIIQTIYDDFNTKTVILVDHLPNHKSYVKMTFEEMEQVDFVTNPKSIVQRFLSCEHREIGQKIVEGVLCEGIETTDPTFDESGPDYPTDNVTARIWVSVETGYPVQFEYEIVRNNGEIRIAGIRDQFQWDVELDESMFEPNIPTGYIDISPH